ncbi:MAG: hypothetical protein ACK4Z6_03285 [Candidatus Methylomirabilales bacterium]
MPKGGLLYPREFRKKVRLTRTSDRPISQVARELGIAGRSCLWRR